MIALTILWPEVPTFLAAFAIGLVVLFAGSWLLYALALWIWRR